MSSYSTTAGTDDWLLLLDQLRPGSQHKHEGIQTVDYCVLVTIVQSKGSAPREAGTTMLVLTDDCVGTIGGGHLELKVIEESRAMLARDRVAGKFKIDSASRVLRIPLGASLGQCCGGYVVIVLERFSLSGMPWVDNLMQYRRDAKPAVSIIDIATADTETVSAQPLKLIVSMQHSIGTLGSPGRDSQAIRTARSILAAGNPHGASLQDSLFYNVLNTGRHHLLLFGAGHVGQAVIKVLQALPYRIDWIDSRETFLENRALPSHVRAVVSDEPELAVDHAPGNSRLLIMTHSHQLDFAICERALKRADIVYCGLIGSATKRARFVNRLKARGLRAEALSRLICPIGIREVSGKHPAEIAIAVAAQLLQLDTAQQPQLAGVVESRPAACSDAAGLSGV